MSTATIGDIDVSYTEAGPQDAVPVVLIHGLAEDGSSWAGTQQALADLHTFAYDLRGHGRSSVGEGDGTLTQLGNDLIAFLEKMTGPAVVVGFSLGGTIALWAAAQRPDLVTGAVVLGTSSVVGRSATGFYAGRIELAGDTSSQEFRDAIRDDTAAALVDGDRLDEITANRLTAIGDGRGYVNAARAMAALNADPLTPSLTNITVHVTVVGAADDTFCPYKAAQIVLGALPDADYIEIPRAGHLMNVDNPDAVTDALRRSITALRSTTTGRKES
ncbi:alpha/beta fold hydrolase [Gordonia amarae]|uniref:Alpha/beta fold hydrolase n=2 Tax=Gordonia amarae TaxID=36821 RepID=A0A857KI99_9ACTN|nr:alpha/beta hydrolase [Gordonia amarae]MCS3878176.1 pimeloyl-ACP methyl ester carboxylesterase [Gordonia amarae]QHN16844.1 alpha/beta fold hydrolase [Gordonia amarae]QHN21369.1 alpha/beta fold hydrolase [Gordonia amarae]QHN30222.1 alpha/beta fold hydrolase [Gordonia amarae]QHN38996.1 alpha/beta fold hydrolase [Gordonia amarae]